MQIISIIMVIASVAGAAVVERALPKANEYISGDCSGSINYGHHSAGLNDVTMDHTTHSVYLNGKWSLWDQNSGNGGSCTGSQIGSVDYPKGACITTDAKSWHKNKPIKCVRNEA
ncbi:hypothetical protein F5Y19DRAFT_407185 [Xylariaceae sp. FL1651]|nr:hypothetical protein F5Y19DRAFT_407185 [Xylariaceae sp. FL1651]